MAGNYTDNPWQDQAGQQPHPSHRSNNPFGQQGPPGGQNINSPWTQEPSQGQGFSSANPYNSNNQASYQPPSGPPPSQRSNNSNPPGVPPRRTATDVALPTGQDRSHQIEVMQSYEASGHKSEADLNIETLQREFPKLDGSLIAAIYGDNNSLSAAREVLQTLEEQ